MNTRYKSILQGLISAVVILSSLLLAGSPAPVQAAEGALGVTVSTEVNCGEVTFTVDWLDGNIPYLFYMDFGDGDSTNILELEISSHTVSHTYPDQGDFVWSVTVIEATPGGIGGFASDVLVLEGPAISLTSNPFPAVLVEGEGDGLVEFYSEVMGGTPPYTYAWDLNGDGVFDEGGEPQASYHYTEAKEYNPGLLVTDGCGFSDLETIPVVVASEEEVCHPTAEKIANAVNTLFPDQVGQEYTCQDIYDLFDGGGEDGGQIGFGRMWKAYQLALTMEELSWEDILDWHLAGSGWGTLLQLDRFAELLADHSLGDLTELVLSEEYSLKNVRQAVRAATRFDADFEDALARSAEGATPGELNQLYKLTADLETDPSLIDAYLAEGLSLVELKQAAKFADRMEADWTEVAEARSAADTWGDINRAYKMATEDISASEILAIGVKEYQMDLKRAGKEGQEAEKDQRTAEKMAEQFGLAAGDVMNLFNGECEGSWACVRQTLREQLHDMAGGLSDKDHKTALQIASKYGLSADEVLDHFQNVCGKDWSCTRAYFKDLDKGKPDQDKDTGKDKDKDTGKDKDKDKDTGKDKDKDTGKDKDKDKGKGKDKNK